MTTRDFTGSSVKKRGCFFFFSYKLISKEIPLLIFWSFRAKSLREDLGRKNSEIKKVKLTLKYEISYRKTLNNVKP